MSRPQPILNAPAAVRWTVGVTVVAHIVIFLIAGGWIGSPSGIGMVLVKLAFVPARYTLPGEIAADPIAVILSPFGHALLHGGWAHLFMNMAFLLAFGSAVARRMSIVQFLVLYATGAAGGALCVFALAPDSVAPLIGASGAVSATVGAVVRIALTPSPDTLPPPPPFHVRRTAIGFVLAFVAVNLISALLPGLFGVEGSIAWEAHLGGFLVGYLLIPLFDRRMEE